MRNRWYRVAPGCLWWNRAANGNNRAARAGQSDRGGTPQRGDACRDGYGVAERGHASYRRDHGVTNHGHAGYRYPPRWHAGRFA